MDIFLAEITKKNKMCWADSDPPHPREVPDKKAKKKKKKHKKRKVRSLQRLVPVPLNHHPHQGSPGIKGMCSLNFWISFSLPRCISVIPLHIPIFYLLSFLLSVQIMSSLLTSQKVTKITYRTPPLLSQRPPPAQEQGEALQRHHRVSICP